MTDSKILLTNIQRFSLHDGPGIRTTVFLKGCSLRCPWCANPENREYRIQAYVKEGVRGTFGVWMSCEEIYREVIKDAGFYGEWKAGGKSPREPETMPGGVTFSGGEPLLQIRELEPLLDRLKRERVHMAMETSLFAPKDTVRSALEYMDLFYIDIKLLDRERCLRLLGGDVGQYMRNLELVFGSGAPVVFRLPVIGGGVYG